MKTRIATNNARADASQYYPFSNDQTVHWPVAHPEYTGGLTGLAEFLALNVCNATRDRGSLRVTVFDGKTEHDHADNNSAHLSACYALDKQAARIDDYDFPRIGDHENLNDYWQRVALAMRLQGAEMVSISYAGWEASRVWFVMEPQITDDERTRMTPCSMPKYEGVPLSRVLEMDPGFVEWCAEKITSPWQTEWRDACREVLNY